MICHCEEGTTFNSSWDLPHEGSETEQLQLPYNKGEKVEQPENCILENNWLRTE